MTRQAFTADGQTAEFGDDVLIQGKLDIAANNGSFGRLTCYTQEVTLAGASTAATVNPPAGAIVLSCDTVVTTAIPVGGGTTGYKVGDGTTADKFGTIVGIIAGTDSDATDYAAAAVPTVYPAAPTITFTATGANFTGGKIRFTCFCLECTGPQS